VVLDQPDEVEALRYHGPPLHVISNGKRLDAAKMQAIVAAGGLGGVIWYRVRQSLRPADSCTSLRVLEKPFSQTLLLAPPTAGAPKWTLRSGCAMASRSCTR
jgi:hypothetical protein